MRWIRRPTTYEGQDSESVKHLVLCESVVGEIDHAFRTGKPGCHSASFRCATIDLYGLIMQKLHKTHTTSGVH